MTWMMMTVMCLLLIAGYPMMMPLLAATVLAFLIYFPNLGIQQIVQQMIGGVKPSALVAVPMFILAADIITRGHSADRLVDLVIGFEAVLLQGLQNELSHRFSLNGSSLSHWIHKAPRQPSYHLFRSAYAARSALVHGYGPKVKLHRIESMSDELRHLLASFIQWLILESPAHGLQPKIQADDWLRILFESPP